MIMSIQCHVNVSLRLNIKFHVQIHNNIYGANSIKLANTEFFSKFLFVHTIYQCRKWKTFGGHLAGAISSIAAPVAANSGSV